MRPVRFVALSEDGAAFVLADEVGRLLALPIDDRISGALHNERGVGSPQLPGTEAPPSLAPRDIQARIRSGESAEDVARIAGVPVDRVLRYAGPVLQERAMLAQHARRTRLRAPGADPAAKASTLAEVVDTRLGQHGIDLEKISWDAYRRDDGTWRIVASWPSGKASATAMWELDKARQTVTPHDDMAQYLCADRTNAGQEGVLRHDLSRGLETRGHEVRRSESGRGGQDPMRVEPPRQQARPGRDPIRAGRDALLASLDRPVGSGGTRSLDNRHPEGGAAETSRRQGAVQPSAFEDDRDTPQGVPAVPSLAVLRPRRGPAVSGGTEQSTSDKPRKRAPSWDDVLFGGAPAARDA
jgi:hypothetical protein